MGTERKTEVTYPSTPMNTEKAQGSVEEACRHGDLSVSFNLAANRKESSS